MADKELHRLKRRELLQMLLEQCEETERLQQESEELQGQLGELEERYERLIKKLNIKDERLNEKDAQIAKLKTTIEEMKVSKAIELEEAGSIAEAALRLNGIFEAAQRSAEQYLMNVKKLSEKAERKSKETTAGLPITEKEPDGEMIRTHLAELKNPPDHPRQQQSAERRQVYGQKIPFDSGWKSGSRRNRLHG